LITPIRKEIFMSFCLYLSLFLSLCLLGLAMTAVKSNPKPLPYTGVSLAGYQPARIDAAGAAFGQGRGPGRKALREKAGLDPAKYAGHSLRAGLATSAAAVSLSTRPWRRRAQKPADNPPLHPRRLIV
jgi:hypothetical protein